MSAQTVYDSIGSKQALVARLNDLIDARGRHRAPSPPARRVERPAPRWPPRRRGSPGRSSSTAATSSTPSSPARRPSPTSPSCSTEGHAATSRAPADRRPARRQLRRARPLARPRRRRRHARGHLRRPVRAPAPGELRLVARPGRGVDRRDQPDPAAPALTRPRHTTRDGGRNRARRLSGPRRASRGTGRSSARRQPGDELATTAPDDDGPIWMVNLMAHRERADYGDGAGESPARRPTGATPRRSAGGDRRRGRFVAESSRSCSATRRGGTGRRRPLPQPPGVHRHAAARRLQGRPRSTRRRPSPRRS